MSSNYNWLGRPTQDPYADFGGSSGYMNLQQPTYTQPGYTSPAPAAQGNGMKEYAMSGDGGSDWKASDWIQAAKMIRDEYARRNPQKPSFAPVPLSPEQKQIHELYLKSLMNPATANNAAYVSDIAKQQLQGLSGMKWTSPHTFSGDVGYGGSNQSFAVPWSPGGSFPTTPQTPPRDPQILEDIRGDRADRYRPNDILQDTRDPFRQTTKPGDTGWSDLTDYGSADYNDPHVQSAMKSLTAYLDAHPEVARNATRTTIGALAAWFGGPVAGKVASDLAGRAYDWFARRYGFDVKTAPLPAPTRTLKDVSDKAPGTKQRKRTVVTGTLTPPPVVDVRPDVLDEHLRNQRQQWWESLRQGGNPSQERILDSMGGGYDYGGIGGGRSAP